MRKARPVTNIDQIIKMKRDIQRMANRLSANVQNGGMWDMDEERKLREALDIAYGRACGVYLQAVRKGY